MLHIIIYRLCMCMFFFFFLCFFGPSYKHSHMYQLSLIYRSQCINARSWQIAKNNKREYPDILYTKSRIFHFFLPKSNSFYIYFCPSLFRIFQGILSLSLPLSLRLFFFSFPSNIQTLWCINLSNVKIHLRTTLNTFFSL